MDSGENRINKRCRSSKKDNKSFVQNMTSRMSGLIPATITKWFSSPIRSGSANGSGPPGDASDSSSEEDAIDSFTNVQPPMKKLRLSHTSPVSANNHYGYTEGNVKSTSNSYDSKPSSAQLQRDSVVFVNTSMTSSSPDVKVNAEQSPLYIDVNSSSSVIKHTHTGHSVEKRKSSLFQSESLPSISSSSEIKKAPEQNRPCYIEEPSFKPNVLGSLFYKGGTMYGGAGASCYFDMPNVKQRSVAVVNENKRKSDEISSATRRVLDLLEHYSSPLCEAKRIPTNTKSYNTKDSLNRSYNSLSSPSGVNLHKMQSLHVPSAATILNIKQRSQLMSSTSVARQIMASHSSSSHIMPYTPPQKRSKGDLSTAASKVKSRLKTADSRDSAESNELPPLNLPKEVLQIDNNNLPTFSFNVSSVPFKASTPLISNKIKKSQDNNYTKKIPEIQTATDTIFKFANPIRLPMDGDNTASNMLFELEKKPAYSPEKAASNVNNTNKSLSKKWRCRDCWVDNKLNDDSCVCCGASKSVGNKKVSDSDNVVVGLPNPSYNKVQYELPNKIEESSSIASNWKCSDCWVNNDFSAEKCVCCGAKCPSSNSKDSTDGVVKDLTDWRCSECWVTNKAEASNCACCTSNKPVSATTSAATPVATTSNTPRTNTSVSTVILATKTQTEKWECPCCLVKNDNSKLECVCCQTAKPGTGVDSKKKVYQFGVPNTAFKFGIPQENSSVTKPIETIGFQSVIKTSKETEKNNNSLKSTPTFSFGIPSSKVNGKLDTAEKSESKTITTDNVVPSGNETFKFGVNQKSKESDMKITKTVEASNIKLKELPIDQENESEQEVPKAQESVNTSLPAVTSIAYFGSPNTCKTPVVPEPSAIKESAISSSDSAAVVPCKPIFTFSTNDANINNTSSVIVNPIQVAPIQASNMFTLNKTEATPVVSPLFGKSAPVTTTAPSTTSTAPIFSFGSDKKATETSSKFNFSFGDSKVEGNTSLVAAFGSKNETICNTPAPSTSLNTSNTFGTLSTPAANPIFGLGQPAQNKNTWPSPNLTINNESSANIFSTNSTIANPLSTTPSFNFGSTTFKVASSGPSMFNNSQNTATAPSMFNNSQNTATAPSMFNNSQNAATAPSMFNNSQNVTTFGGPANNSSSTFGSQLQASNNLQSFASSQPSMNSAFGSNQNSTNIFGNMPVQNVSNPPSIFSNPTISSSPFGGNSAAPASASSSQQGLFGAVQAPPQITPAFAFTASTSTPTFNNPPSAPPAFNFGTPQPAGVFGFGQTPQTPQNAIYNFGAATASPPQVQFNMGSPGTMIAGGRKVRKARRTLR